MRRFRIRVVPVVAALAMMLGFFCPRAHSTQASAQAPIPGHSSSNLKVGDPIPSFRAVDQFGKERDFANLQGPHGLVILFFRSADW